MPRLTQNTRSTYCVVPVLFSGKRLVEIARIMQLGTTSSENPESSTSVRSTRPSDEIRIRSFACPSGTPTKPDSAAGSTSILSSACSTKQAATGWRSSWAISLRRGSSYTAEALREGRRMTPSLDCRTARLMASLALMSVIFPPREASRVAQLGLSATSTRIAAPSIARPCRPTLAALEELHVCTLGITLSAAALSDDA